MMAPEVVLEVTGHAIGGVCPFGLENPIDIYLDQSLKEFEKYTLQQAMQILQ